MEDGDAFTLNYKFKGDSLWSSVEEWVIGTDFNNGAWVKKIVNIQIPNKKKKVQFQFQGKSNKKNDIVYIDDVLVEGKRL